MTQPPAGTSGEKPGLSRGLDRVLRTALFLVPFGVLGNLALSWFATDHDKLRELGRPDLRYLYLALFLALFPWVTNTLRLLIWARFIGHRVSFRDMFRVTLGAELSSSVFPTSSGGEVFRWGMMVQKGIPQGHAASIVTLGYIEDMAFFLVAIPVSVFLSRAWELPVLASMGRELQGQALVVIGIGIAAVLVVRLLFAAVLRGTLGQRPRAKGLRFTARLKRKFRRTWQDFRSVHRLVIRRGKSRFLLTFLITAVQWSCRYSVVTALAFFLGARVDPVLFFLLQWVIFTAMMFIPTPGATGGAEAAFYLVYEALLPAGLIGIATAGWRMLTFYVQLALGSIIFLAFNIADARTRARRRREAGGEAP
ncbi:lysylphosphatidylglycerol synthase transmembrane domain-containing protein [Longimicrobium sp.]|uniref:lysylphosphatidylglycerol synthase transmembrane domain-containing protein n=1 Tax=Longimicrobium sp. TaxID=2029185 RepID=UPI002E356433|nr:lysylphosphatidylglycerol synthase transmembrane domain-containing protein [Longimicrobium sp.]HEX6039888.1 lysylphosphatidylglycerol synthase transmembrane domain-containing protein [Longimicrobium sp.]